jgi:acetyl/propionyl-CoA carboxylase alpha subunit
MRRMNEPQESENTFKSRRYKAEVSFSISGEILEKSVPNPRHIAVQAEALLARVEVEMN